MASDTPESTPEGGAQAQQQTEIHLDDSQSHAAYANFARVTATPEEVIIDFGLNPTPFAQGKQEVKVAHRLIVNFYTAKRLAYALQQTLARHEGNFGTIELDVRRRATPGSGGQPQAGGGDGSSS